MLKRRWRRKYSSLQLMVHQHAPICLQELLQYVDLIINKQKERETQNAQYLYLRLDVVEEEVNVKNGLYSSADPHNPLPVIPTKLGNVVELMTPLLLTPRWLVNVLLLNTSDRCYKHTIQKLTSRSCSGRSSWEYKGNGKTRGRTWACAGVYIHGLARTAREDGIVNNSANNISTDTKQDEQ